MKNPKEELLEIPIKVTQYFSDSDDYLNRNPKTTYDNASKKAFDFLFKAEKLIKEDKVNIKKCIAFVNRKFPHVRYTFSEFGISLENISEEEIAICRTQRGLKFNYYSSPDN